MIGSNFRRYRAAKKIFVIGFFAVGVEIYDPRANSVYYVCHWVPAFSLSILSRESRRMALRFKRYRFIESSSSNYNFNIYSIPSISLFRLSRDETKLSSF